MITSKPFLKWAGNKHKLMPIISPLLGNGNRLVEPFTGSGAVFMASDFPKYLLCDINADLIGLFNNLKYNPTAVITEITHLFDGTNNNETKYYELRTEFNSLQPTDIRKSALFVYLNRHAFNGLCRYNSKGGFNVPFGKYKTVYFPIDELQAFAQKSVLAEFHVMDFNDCLDLVTDGDVVYCDPPYVPLTATANFTAYAADGFGINKQQQLADAAKKLTAKNISVIISNHDTDISRALYADATITAIDVRRSIAGNGANRGMAKELIAVFNGEKK
jgi:DNA adenine methylase